MMAKALLVFIGLRAHVHVWSTGTAHWVWLAGKIVPLLIPPAFPIDAYLRPRRRILQRFWAIVTLVVPLFSACVVVWESRQ